MSNKYQIQLVPQKIINLQQYQSKCLSLTVTSLAKILTCLYTLTYIL